MNFIFDNEWVLVQNDWEQVAQAVAQGLDFEQRDNTYYFTDRTPINGHTLKQSFRLFNPSNNNPLYDCNRGVIEPKELWRQVLQSPAYQRQATPENIDILQQAMRNLTTAVEPANIDLLHRLKAEGHNLYMLSNSTPDITAGNMERHNYFELFEHCFFSFGEYEPQTGWIPDTGGARKPEASAYQKLVEHITSRNPAPSVFIDDKLENVEASKAAGLPAIQYKIGDPTSLGQLLKTLGYLPEG